MEEQPGQRELVTSFGDAITQVLATEGNAGGAAVASLLADPTSADEIAQELLDGAREIADSFEVPLAEPHSVEVGFNSLDFADLYSDEPAPPGVTAETFAGRWHLMWMADPDEDDHDYWVAAWLTVVTTPEGLRIGPIELEE
jgi:hypothetical protein